MDSARVTYEKDKVGEWRWHFQATNGDILADGAEGYKNRGDAVNGFNRVCELVGGNPALVEVVFADE